MPCEGGEVMLHVMSSSSMSCAFSCNTNGSATPAASSSSSLMVTFLGPGSSTVGESDCTNCGALLVS